ncbi:helix-turn-helix transcriptional regulator [Methylotenera sp.]|uniref:helix-turn-helix domain-containing protein n=1 Tax=Methylotenera sp. TaxID=2051956 RepID=UPI002487DD8A|nr:helix-turn-helix transcriptional regulator [Methylotenera sp.]MDI1297725.1 helix-turn-helix transcriptional regulator [Methylotenera sp.]
MSKHSGSIVSTPPETLKSLEKLGQRIRANRIAQSWTVKEMAERLFCSQNTYRAIEAGKPSASIGIIANALWLFGQIDSLDSVAPVPLQTNATARVRKSKNKSIAGTIGEDERDF